MRAVDGGDDHDPDDVIDDREREQVGAYPVGQAGADQREHAQGERGIRGHRRAPAGGRRAARVDGQVYGDRNDHPANPDQHRKREPPPFSQLAHVELAARLEPGDQEEERHQPGVDPAVQIVGHARAADPDRQHACPSTSGTRMGPRSPRPARRSWRPAKPRRCRSRCAGTGAAVSRGPAPTRCGARAAQRAVQRRSLSDPPPRVGRPPTTPRVPPLPLHGPFTDRRQPPAHPR